jgi:hypothetical protein
MDQSATNVADPRSRLSSPIYPDLPEFSPYRERYFLGRPALTGIDLSSRIATLTLFISEQAPDPRSPHPPRPFPQGTRLFLGVSGSSSTEEEIPTPINLTTQVSLTMPLNGSTNSYPEDAYFAALGPASVRAEIPGDQDSYYEIDFAKAYRLPTATQEVDATQVPGIYRAFPNGDACLTRFGFIFTRSGGELFVWLMAALPLVLLLLISSAFGEALAALREDREATTSHVFGGSAATQAAVAFLAILPLRAVLVPGQISTITRVDYVLGAELALLVLGLCIGAIRVNRENALSQAQ